MKRDPFLIFILGGILAATGTYAQGISLERKAESPNPFATATPEKSEPTPENPFVEEGSAVTLPPPPIPPLTSTQPKGTSVIPPATDVARKKQPRVKGEVSASSTVLLEVPAGTAPRNATIPAPAVVSTDESAATPVPKELPCPILIESGDSYEVLSVGGQIIVRFALVENRTCVLAVESKVPWISVNAFDGKTLILDFSANPRRRNREGQVVLANARESRSLQVVQAPCQDPHCEGALDTDRSVKSPSKDSDLKPSKGDSLESR
jgi:hypothetical protein